MMAAIRPPRILHIRGMLPKGNSKPLSPPAAVGGQAQRPLRQVSPLLLTMNGGRIRKRPCRFFSGTAPTDAMSPLNM